ncbi:hypothetical Protein YC6258_04035 [Gynuella sunshinyii YC6258]|uniref:Uncharacterized protein n=1 Tax=Gynuella sunshinyii YC6258 TaxID=1445510 RepID=A0A0C5VP71_9GAMM|nr:hypothetical Protein YC6258_04035 [Gynuella sunshinyii YC6258]
MLVDVGIEFKFLGVLFTFIGLAERQLNQAYGEVEAVRLWR